MTLLAFLEVPFDSIPRTMPPTPPDRPAAKPLPNPGRQGSMSPWPRLANFSIPWDQRVSSAGGEAGKSIKSPKEALAKIGKNSQTPVPSPGSGQLHSQGKDCQPQRPGKARDAVYAEPMAEFNSPFPTPDADKAFIGQTSCAMSGDFPANAPFVWGGMPKAVSDSGSPLSQTLQSRHS